MPIEGFKDHCNLHGRQVHQSLLTESQVSCDELRLVDILYTVLLHNKLNMDVKTKETILGDFGMDQSK